ncbi:MAG: hypothetical protein WCX73_03480 [Candidatus Pacearchaeota archaeon]|jgi:hypothetical protein
MHDTLALLVRVNDDEKAGGQRRLVLSFFKLEENVERITTIAFQDNPPKNSENLTDQIKSGIVLATKSFNNNHYLKDLTKEVADKYGGSVCYSNHEKSSVEFPLVVQEVLVNEYFKQN